VEIKIIAARLERVRVDLELLADGVALPLNRLAVRCRDLQQIGDPPVDLGDKRIVRIEVAGFAGPVCGNTDIVGDLGRSPPRVDSLDQRRADCRIEEVADDEQVELRSRDLLDARRQGEELRPRDDLRGRSLCPWSYRAAGSPL
jgi:hypothetical protein